MLRLHLTAGDLLRVRFAEEPAPLVELGLAVAAWQRRRDPVFAGWRHVQPMPAAARPLLDLVPSNGAGPLFLDPVSDGVDDGIELVRDAPATLVDVELRRVTSRYRPMTPWIRDLADRNRRAWRTLEGALRAGHGALLHRQWPRVRAGFRADRAWGGRLVTELGLGGALTALCPGARWDGDALVIGTPGTPVVHIRPGGRGLLLMPSTFVTGQPLAGRYWTGDTVLIYPSLTPYPLTDPAPDGDPLAALLGRTRADLLRLLVDPHTTTGLATALHVSRPTVSEHTGTLRAAGLVVTERAGREVRHCCTSLALRLLAGTG